MILLMLTKEDLGEIRNIVETSEKRVAETITKTIITAVGEMIDQNILPQFDELHEEIFGVKKEISEIKQELRTINAKMVTKGGLEDRLTDFRLSLAGSAV